jgi:hypothetical protein
MATDVRQTHFRFGKDDGTEATHTWYALVDTNATIPVDTPFLLRFTEQESGGTAAANTDAQFQYNHNGAGWVNITTTSAVVKAVAVNAFANGANCTKRLSGTGTFETSGAGCTEDGTSGGTANDIVASGNSETECGLQIVSTAVSNGDTIQFRFTSPDWTITYTITPSATVQKITDTTLVVAEIAHGHTSDAIALIQAHTLVVQDATHGHTTDAIALIQAFTLAVQDATHGHTTDGINLAQNFTLAVADGLHSHAIDNVVLTQNINYTLTVGDVIHGHVTDSIQLSEDFTLVVTDGTHLHVIDNVTVTENNSATQLIVDDVTHLFSSSEVGVYKEFHKITADEVIRAGLGKSGREGGGGRTR